MLRASRVRVLALRNARSMASLSSGVSGGASHTLHSTTAAPVRENRAPEAARSYSVG
jgi:hypothetical protein